MFSRLPFSFMFLFVMITGTLLSLSSSHWLGIWAGLEINLIGFLPLLVYQKSMMESESGVKYFIIQALGSALLMFGSLSMYSLFFTWEMSKISSIYLVGMMIISCGLCMKMGLFPFHFWLPSVMAGLPWMSCLLLATWQKLAPLFLISLLMEVNSIYWFVLVFCVISAGSSLMGGIGGMNQTQVRSLLAYSSIGHLGWLVFACLYGDWLMKIYLFIYILISLCIFISLYYSNLSMMKDLNNLGNQYYSELGIMVMLLSLGGLPPLLGFISKLLVVLSSMNGSMWGILFILIMGSLMSLFYYLSLFFSLVLNKIKSNGKLNHIYLISNNLLSLGLLINLMGGLMLMTTGIIENI
uniref:NADH-ubiquinone oxidoreductase chain 2 n=1 Tax=Struthiolaria papulosa TaxID=2821810 RepID=A0A8A6KFP5_9CAEN|nr:NADH dehydrogenase subunit 2 [Struthiolaria papulosa]QTI82427.1 NADH dehydrogenase subunit 2 [Struthiolaria papulosa]